MPNLSSPLATSGHLSTTTSGLGLGLGPLRRSFQRPVSKTLTGKLTSMLGGWGVTPMSRGAQASSTQTSLSLPSTFKPSLPMSPVVVSDVVQWHPILSDVVDSVGYGLLHNSGAGEQTYSDHWTRQD